MGSESNKLQLEKPGYVIIGFPTARKSVLTKTMAEFDNNNLTNIKVYLNSEVYPYDNTNINFSQRKSALLCEIYANFQTSYYYKIMSEPCVGTS